MEEVYKELEALKSEIEALKEEYQVKCQLSESLRRAHDEEIVRLKEAKAKIEKQAREIDSKAAEICSVKRMYEDLKSSSAEKESALKSLGLANEDLRTSFREKMKNLEGENKKLVSALDEADTKIEEREKMISSYREEIDGLKSLLSASQRRCSDAEQRAQAPREVRRRDLMLLKSQEEKAEVENQLKWKMEQFRHLEEAHSKLQDGFQVAKREWGLDRSNLLDEIHTLQTNLDSRTRVAEDLRSQLNMCNQALAHEESRRKLLEVQISESRALYDNVVSGYEEARSAIEALTARRDDEIASLRNALAAKATTLKETEYRRSQVEQENEELRESLKEYQEAEINGVDATASLKTLRQKFKALEQAHRGCSEKLKTREAEWKAQIEKVGINLDECLSQLSSRNKQLWELQIEMEGCNSSLLQQKLENEELSVVLMVLKSKFLESCSTLETLNLGLEQRNAQVEERIALMTKQVEKKKIALIQAQAKTMQEREMVDSLQSRTEYLESIEQKYIMALKELDTYKGLLEESSRNFDCLKEQTSQKENNLQEDLRKASNSLDQANYALAEKTSELNEVKFGLEQQKLVIERMEKIKSDLETQLNKYHDEKQAATRELEVVFLAKMQTEKSFMEEKENFHQITEERDKIIEELRQHIFCLEEDNAKQESEFAALIKLEVEKTSELNKVKFESEQQKLVIEQMEKIKSDLEAQLNKYHDERQEAARELELALLAKMQTEKSLMEEKENFCQTTEERDKIIEELRQHIFGLKEDNARQESEFAALIKLEAEKTSELNKVKFESEQQKLVIEQVEKIKSDLEVQLNKYHDERQEATRELELALLAKMQTEKSLMEEKENFCQITAERDKIIEELRQHIFCLEVDNARQESEFAALIKSEAEKTSELNEVNFESEQQKLVIEQMEKIKSDLEAQLNKYHDERQEATRELELALLAKMQIEKSLMEEKENFRQITEERDKIIEELRQHIFCMEEDNARQESELVALVKSEAEKATEMEEKFLEIAEDVDRRLKVIQTKLDFLEQNHALRESEILMVLEQEKAKWFRVMKEKEDKIADVQKHVLSLEQNLTQFVEAAAASKLAGKQLEISKLYEALQKFVAAYLLYEQEIQFKNILTAELETEISTLKLKLKLEEKISYDSKNCLELLKAEIAMERLEKEKEQILVLNELKCVQSDKITLEDQLGQCKGNIKSLHDITALLTSEREKLVGKIMRFNEMLGVIFHMDEDLTRNWVRVMQKARNEDTVKNSDRDVLFSSSKVDGRQSISPLRNKAGQVNGRSPLKEHNC